MIWYGIISLAIGFALGRYAVPPRVRVMSDQEYNDWLGGMGFGLPAVAYMSDFELGDDDE